MHADHEAVGRDGEERARLADAAQVERREHQHQHRGARAPRARETNGIAEAAFWTPEETDTATVRT